MRNIFFLVAVIFFFSCHEKKNKLDFLIPQPLSIEKHNGDFVLSAKTSIAADTEFSQILSYLGNEIEKLTDLKLSADQTQNEDIIVKRLNGQNDLGKDGYFLSIDKTHITISANNQGGAFNGVQTLLQLIALDSSLTIPCGIITDKPIFPWRGFMLDVARQYYPKEVILKLIDALALYKTNILHLHLSDDQGWRIEIESLPELTMTGSKANAAFKDQSSGFYSKVVMREIIEYAALRNITIVPEIDMPGHSRAAITSYPHLSCFGGPGKFDRSNPRDSLPFYDPICPGKETTFEFYEKAIKELAELFPSEYIHIGGDETSKSCWKNCKNCQKRITGEKLKDVNDLQNYFAKRIQKIIESNGKKAMGWDELYETGAPSSFAVMAWREEQWGVEADEAGHTVVMAPSQYYYFNYNQVYDNERRWAVSAPLHMVYKHNLPDLKSGNLKGMHACYWGGIDSTGTYMFESIFPRIIALAEKSWSEKNNDYKGFLDRLGNHYYLLDKMNTPYYIAHPEGLCNDLCIKEKYTVDLSVPIGNAVIRYTLDGSEPDLSSPGFTHPFDVEIGTVIKAKTFLANGKSSITVEGKSILAELRPALAGVKTSGNGLKLTVYKGRIRNLRDREKLSPVSESIVTELNYPDPSLKHDFGLSFEGYINIPADGVYSFILNSCDGSNLFIGGDTVVSNDGSHPRLTIMQRAALAKGLHALHIDYFYSSIFEKHLVVEMAGKGMERQEIPANMLSH